MQSQPRPLPHLSTISGPSSFLLLIVSSQAPILALAVNRLAGSGFRSSWKENSKNYRANPRYDRIISLVQIPGPRLAPHVKHSARSARQHAAKTSEYPGTAARPHAHASGPAPRSDGARETLFPD